MKVFTALQQKIGHQFKCPTIRIQAKYMTNLQTENSEITKNDDTEP